jgi:hypothetical protein
VITHRQVLGQVVLCKGCCCGNVENGRPEVPVERIKAAWKQGRLSKSLQLTVSGCLGPCDVPNVVLLIGPESQEWLANIEGHAVYDAIVAWAEDCHRAAKLLPIPPSLAEYRLGERFTIGGGRA